MSLSSSLSLDHRIRASVLETIQELQNSGELLPNDQLQDYRARFSGLFGPEKLMDLDGEALLDRMHSLREDSLVYWLEYKNDEEFPTQTFGSISGGSALKFGFYQRRETGAWMTGTSQKQTMISTAEAVDLARRNREQLRIGGQLLERMPSNATEEDYRQLQQDLEVQSPAIVNSAWGHKYFSLLFPDRLDTFHVEDYQRFHLIKLLQLPPQESGRYRMAGLFVSMAKDLGVSLHHLVQALNRHNGRPYKVWRIGTSIGRDDNIWELMRDGNCTAIGWPDLGDLSDLNHDQKSKDWLRQQILAKYDLVPQLASRKAGEVLNFAKAMAEGDLALASNGSTILGIGRVSGGYRYDSTFHAAAPHTRPVEWLSLGEWQQPTREGLRTTVFRIRKYPENLIGIEQQLLDEHSIPPSPVVTRKSGPVPRLTGIPGAVQSILERKGQVILYGPPGTGKTHWARLAGLDLASLGAYNCLYHDLNADQKRVVSGDESQVGLLRFCTFHPSYGYEDFLEGYRPQESAAGNLVFHLHDGIFKTLCADAARQPDRRFYLIIDEINRGDIPRIFGELLTILEKDKRGQALYLPLSGHNFRVPENVHIIGTMNTADRSIALLDTALRRRFGFVELMPDSGILSGAKAGEIPLGPWLSALNESVRSHIGPDARNLQIGHAYLMDSGRPITDFALLARILSDDILPLLEEYCYEDYQTLAKILGKGLVDEDGQRIRKELFTPDRQDELVHALLAPFPEVATSPQVTALQAAEVDPEEDSGDDEGPE